MCESVDGDMALIFVSKLLTDFPSPANLVCKFV